MNALGRISFQRRQTLVIFFGTSFLILLVAAPFFITDLNRFRRNTVKSVSTVAELVAENCAAPLDFNQPQAAREALASLHAQPDIVGAYVYRKSGELFAMFPNTPQTAAAAPKPGPNGYEIAGNRLILSRGIQVKGDTLGTLCLVTSLEDLSRRVREYQTVVGLVLAASLVLAFLVSRKIKDVFSAPILALVKATRTVAQDKNYSVRVPKHRDDEIGQLIDDFNGMLSQIKDRDDALEQARAGLEKAVAERTIELRDEVAERKRAEASAEAERDFVLQVVNLMGDGLIVTEDDEHISFANPSFAQLVGLRTEEVLGRAFTEFVIPTEPDTRGSLHPDTRRDAPHEFRLRRSDGSLIPVQITSVPRLRDGQPDGAISTVVDLTERKHVEDALHQAKDAAEAANRAKSEFLAVMSHEIRTPMNAVIGMTRLLLDTRLDPRQREFVSAVRDSSDALLELINGILDFSKIESSRVVLEPVEFELRPVVDSVLELLAPRAQQKNLELAAILSPEIPKWFHGDDVRLRQILVNLAGNAIKFTERGHVSVRVTRAGPKAGPTTAGASEAAAMRLRFEVTDTGIGIHRDAQRQLFAPFTQADTTTTRRYGGTGLGLAISKRLAELMGGEIGLISSPGKGSTFWFTVTLAPTPTPPNAPQWPALEQTRILVADHHPLSREALCSLLQSWGCKPHEAPDGPSALAQLRTAAESTQPFQFALVDFQLQGLSGPELGAHATQLPRSPAIILLAPATDPTASQPTPGVIAHLARPVKQSSLLDCLRNALSPAAARPTPPPPRDHPPSPQRQPAPTRPLRILVAEDHAINRRLVLLMLEQLGYHPRFVANGREAVETTAQSEFDVVLMDCQMPIMDGYEATREIRRREANRPGPGRPLPIIALTANAMRGDRERCLAAGMSEYLSKPVRLEELQRMLSTIENSANAPRSHPPSDPSSPAPRQPPQPHPGLNAIRHAVAGLQREFGSDAAVELLAAFLSDTPTRLAEFRTLAQADDRTSLGRSAHSLAGSSGIFGLEQLRKLGLALEERCVRAPTEPAGPLIESIATEFETVRPELERLCSAARDATTATAATTGATTGTT